MKPTVGGKPERGRWRLAYADETGVKNAVPTRHDLEHDLFVKMGGFFLVGEKKEFGFRVGLFIPRRQGEMDLPFGIYTHHKGYCGALPKISWAVMILFDVGYLIIEGVQRDISPCRRQKLKIKRMQITAIYLQ